MRNTDPLHHVERAIENVRNGHLTATEAAQRIAHCLDLLPDLPAELARELKALASELREMRWDGGGDYATALDAQSVRVIALRKQATAGA